MIEKSEVRLTLIDRLVEAHVRILMDEPTAPSERLYELHRDTTKAEYLVGTIANRLGLEPLPEWEEIREMAKKVLANASR